MASASYSLADLSKKNRGRPLLEYMCYCVCVAFVASTFCLFLSFCRSVGRVGSPGARLLGIFSDLDDEALIIHLLRRRLVCSSSSYFILFSGYSFRSWWKKKS